MNWKRRMKSFNSDTKTCVGWFSAIILSPAWHVVTSSTNAELFSSFLFEYESIEQFPMRVNIIFYVPMMDVITECDLQVGVSCYLKNSECRTPHASFHAHTQACSLIFRSVHFYENAVKWVVQSFWYIKKEEKSSGRFLNNLCLGYWTLCSRLFDKKWPNL